MVLLKAIAGFYFQEYCSNLDGYCYQLLEIKVYNETFYFEFHTSYITVVVHKYYFAILPMLHTKDKICV